MNVFHRLFLLAATTVAPVVTLGWLFWTEIEKDLTVARAERAGVADARALWSDYFKEARAIAPCARGVGESCAGIARLNEKTQSIRDLTARSQLMLDPELASFKLVDSTLLRGPDVVQADAGFIRALAQPRASAEPGAIWSALGRTQSSIERLLSGAAQTADAATIAASLEEVSQASAAYAFSGRMLALSQDIHDSDLAAFESDRAALLDAIERLFTTSTHHLEKVLDARLADLERRLQLGFLFSFATLALAAALMAVIGRSILSPQRALVATMNGICDGNLHARVPYRDYSNETGEIARAVEIFRTAMIDRQMLAQHLEQERALLERKVEMRTLEVAETAARAEATAHQLAMALAISKAGVWGVDTARGRFWMSPEAERLCGGDFSPSSFSGGFWTLLVPEDGARVASVVREFVQDGAPRVETDMRVRRPDGSIRWIQASLERIHPTAGLGLFVDVTERKEQELRLEAASIAAEAANRAKSEFLAMMSHEIRTPLNGMLGMSAALGATQLDARQREMITIINQSGDILLTLLKDVLDLSKIEAGRMELEMLPFDPVKSVQTVAALFHEAAAEKSIDLRVHVCDDSPSAIVGDAVRVRQILQNLTSNAIKFTDAGRVEVRLRSRPVENGRVRLRFEVEDTGCGLTQAEMTRVFDRFVQAESSISRRFGGTGLGLSICRNLADLMGGEVGVESTAGAGSTFWFEASFPVTVAPADAICEDTDDALPHDAVKVLAADDNEINRRVLDVLLSQIGIKADFACDGAQAVEAARARAYDLILMDIHMPVMDGIEAAHRIRAAGASSGAPIIALTADAMASHVEIYRGAGMSDVVAKPVQPAALVAAIARALQLSSDASPVAQDAA